MKKNLITVIILALVLVNLILTVILTFTIIPQTKKSNALIDQVCAAIGLELEAGQEDAAPEIPIKDIETYKIEESFTVSLKDSGTAENASDDKKKKHYAIFSVSLSMDKNSKGYKKTYKGAEGLAEKETIIQSEINTIVSNYTIEEFNADGYRNVKNEILESMQEMFGKDFIVGVNFSSVTTE